MYSSQPSEKRQRLSAVTAADLSTSFRPLLVSTRNARALERQLPYSLPSPVGDLTHQTSSHLEQVETSIDQVVEQPVHSGDSDTLQVTHPNITQPEWPDRQPILQETSRSDSVSVWDHVRCCNLDFLGGPGDPCYKLLRKGTNRKTDCIFELSMGYMFLRDKVVKKTRRSWKCSKNEKGCTARIHTPLEYDDPDVADDLHLDLTVFVISDYHTCQPDPSIYYKKKLMRRCKYLVKKSHTNMVEQMLHHV